MYTISVQFARQSDLPWSIPRNLVESDLRCTSRIYFDDVADNVTMTLHNVTLTSQEPCQHNNKCGYISNFTFASANKQNRAFFVHSTTRNAPYVYLRLDWILELCWTFLIESLHRLPGRHHCKMIQPLNCLQSLQPYEPFYFFRHSVLIILVLDGCSSCPF